MNPWTIAGSVLFGGVFVLFGYWRVDAFDSRAMRFLLALFLFGAYCGIVIFGTSDKKRSLSLPAQTFLGVFVAIAIAAVFGASLEGYGIAALIGLILGSIADKWVEYVQPP